MAYFLPVVSRSYSLIPIFLFLLADIYPKRNNHPYLYSILLILLSQIHILLWGLCSICCSLFLFEEYKKVFSNKILSKDIIKTIFSTFILIFNFCFTAYFFRDLIISKFNEGIIEKLTTTGNYLFPNFKLTIFNYLEIFSWEYYVIILSLCIISIYIFLNNKKVFFIILFSILYIELIFLFIYEPCGVPYQKAFIAILIIIFSIWVCNLENKNKNITSLSLAQNISFYILLLILFFNPFIGKLAIEEKYNYFSTQSLLTQTFKDKVNEKNQVLFIHMEDIEIFVPVIVYFDKSFIKF